MRPSRSRRFAAANRPAQVVVYCVYGLEVSQQAAAQLRAAGWDARYLQGGIEGLIDDNGIAHASASGRTWA